MRNVSIYCRCAAAALFLASSVFAMTAHAQIALSSNDGHTILENGAQVASGGADTLSLIDLGGSTPRVVQTVHVPGSVVGPPTAVAMTKDGRYAIVSCATRLDPADASKIVPDTRVFVVDLQASPPKIVQEAQAGLAPASVALSPDNSLVLVANRNAGTVSIFKLASGALTPAGTLDTGNPKSGPSGLIFLPGGKTALLSRDGDSMLNVLRIDGVNVTIDKRPLTAGMRPYTLALSGDGKHAAVSNMGRGDGDVDTVSLIDLSREPFRVVETFAVGGSPEGLRFSPDGKFLAVGLQEGSTKAKTSVFATDGGTLVMLAVEGSRLSRVADARIGHWNQGIAFARDGKTLLVQNMVERTIGVFGWDGARLTEKAPLQFENGPAAITTPWP